MIDKTEWKNKIKTLREKTVDSDKEKLKKAIVKAITERIPNKRFGILFSGGVDSSLISLLCMQKNADFVCYSVGLANASDLEYARKAAEEMNLEFRPIPISPEEAEKTIEKTAKLMPEPDVVNVGVGSVLYAAAERAKKDGIEILFSGLGSEEIFAGYERHSLADDKHEECWNGLEKMWERDINRDQIIAKKLGLEILTPFLDDDVIANAMGIDASRKINKQFKKIILREIAEDLGLPKEFAWRKKKAAQYGSRFDKAIQKIAKQKGFEYKKDYVASLK